MIEWTTTFSLFLIQKWSVTCFQHNQVKLSNIVNYYLKFIFNLLRYIICTDIQKSKLVLLIHFSYQDIVTWTLMTFCQHDRQKALKLSLSLRYTSRVTFRKQLELQLTSMWPGMRRSLQLLPGDILRRTMLTSDVYGIQTFP